jgi:hypothetical protein
MASRGAVAWQSNPRVLTVAVALLAVGMVIGRYSAWCPSQVRRHDCTVPVARRVTRVGCARDMTGCWTLW